MLLVCFGNYNPVDIKNHYMWWQCGMASIRLETPEPFDFENPDGWVRWKSQFQQASGLSNDTQIRGGSTLLYTIGPDADNDLTSTFRAMVGKITKW